MPMWRHRWQRPHDRLTKWSTNGRSSRRFAWHGHAIGVSERALAVLNALISFYPDTTLTGEDDLIVFPSNELLCLRTHGMPASTLRRQLAALVDAGLIVRRDSPNGKRYARKGRAGEIKLAFGFDLAPLVVRAEEFEGMAQEIEAETRAIKLAKERITLCRRDIAKMIATGIEEGVPTGRVGQGPASWQELHAVFRGLVEGVPRTASREELEPRPTLCPCSPTTSSTYWKIKLKQQIRAPMSLQMSATNRIQIQTLQLNLNLASEKAGRRGRSQIPERRATERTYPLGMVLSACPDIVDYAKGGIANWRDFLATAAVVRPMLGISPSAWEEARTVMGEAEAAVVVACLLQRSSTIQSAGGYLRELTRKAGEGEFSLGPILMAQINAKNRERRSA